MKNIHGDLISYEGIEVSFYDMSNSIETIPGNRCPLCLKKINDNKLYYVTNNHMLFPDLYIHKECASSKEECIKRLIAEYEEAKRCLTKIIETQLYVWI